MLCTEVDSQLLDELLEWSDWRASGRKWTRIAEEVTREFWDLWADYKDEIKAMGIRVFRDEDSDDFKAIWVSTEVDPGSLTAAEPCDDQAPVVRGTLRCPESAKRWYLRVYQNDAYFTCLQAVRGGANFVIDANEMGLGKTWDLLEVVKQLGINFGVVCPANTVTKWTNTAIDMPFQLEPEFVLSYDVLRRGKTDYLTRETAVIRKKNITSFSWNTVDKVALIFDEIHVCAGTDSLNGKMLKAAIDDPNVLVLGASATAFNSPLEMRAIGYGLGLHKFVDWWQWCKKMGCRPGPFGGLIFNTGMSKRAPTANQKRARAKLLEIHQHVFPKHGCRVQKAEIKDQLPENYIMAETVDLAWDDPRIKESLAEIDAKELADEEKATAKEQSVSDLTLNTRARQRCELAKLPAFHERILELRREDMSVIVFLNYRESITLLHEWLKSEAALFVGGLSREEQDSVKLSFQDNSMRVIICQAEAGSASIDLDDTIGDFPRRSLISPGYSARTLTQQFGRPHRGPTTKSDVMQWVLFAAGTVEERACRIVQHKLNNQGLINDGDLAGVTQII